MRGEVLNTAFSFQCDQAYILARVALVSKLKWNKTAIFVNNSELNFSGHIFAFHIVKKIAKIASTNKKDLNEEKIKQALPKSICRFGTFRTSQSQWTK